LTRPGDFARSAKRESFQARLLDKKWKPKQKLKGAKMSKPLELVTTENNGPATIVTACEMALKALKAGDLETVEGWIDDIEHLARVSCVYIHQIKAVYSARWCDVRKEYEDKSAADKERYQAMNRPPISGLRAELLEGHKPC
jgi:hypothetical protein